MTLKDSKIDIKFSVIIPYYQQKIALTSCLKALSAQDYNEDIEILVVYHLGEEHIDQLKDDYPRVLWVANDQRPNPYKSRNLGARTASGIYLCFIDSSCFPRSNWLTELNTFIIQNPETQALAGKIEVIPKSAALKDQAHGVLYLNNRKNVERKYGVPAGHLITSKSLFEQYGGFGTDTVSGNDIVFTRKLIENGVDIEYVDEAVIEYPGNSYDTLTSKMSKYAEGVAYHSNRSRKSSFYGFLPMRLGLFNENLKYRNLDHLGLIKKIRLWFVVWGLKIRFNLGVIQGR